MHAYRCKECTLKRCDADGEVCSECMENAPVNGAIGADFTLNTPGSIKDSWIYTLKSMTIGSAAAGATQSSAPAAAPRQAPSAISGGTAVLIPGDHKHNAAMAAAFLMAVSWGTLMTFAIANGRSPTKTDPAEMHALLNLFANSP